LHLAEANELHQWTVARGAGDDDGVGRQVSVDEAYLVSCLQAGSRLQDEVYRLVRGEEVACAEHLGEELTPERLEDDPLGPFLSLTHGADVREVRVLDLGSTVKFIQQMDKP